MEIIDARRFDYIGMTSFKNYRNGWDFNFHFHYHFLYYLQIKKIYICNLCSFLGWKIYRVHLISFRNKES